MRNRTLLAACLTTFACYGCGSSSSNEKPNTAAGATGGTSAQGGAGSSSGGSGGAPIFNPPPHQVGACDKLGTAGVLENITPADLHFESWCQPSAMCPAGAIITYGAHGLAADPTVSGKLWLGTAAMGIWKTEDCGASWVKIDTGTHSMDIDSGRNWSFAIDPTNPQVVWTVSGYGASGIWKSLDGGVNFDNMVTADIESIIPAGGFVEKITLEPKNPSHVLVTFHDQCKKDDGTAFPCMVVSQDAGMTWTVVTSPAPASEGDGQTMLDANTWYFGNGGGLWRTTNAGSTWDQVFTQAASGSVYTASDGSFYVGQNNTMARSLDGISWATIQNSQGGGTVNGGQKMVDDGTRMYTSSGQYFGPEPTTGWYYSFPLSDPTQWEPIFMPQTIIAGGSNVVYDADHRLFYSANLTGGLWRVVLP